MISSRGVSGFRVREALRALKAMALAVELGSLPTLEATYRSGGYGPYYQARWRGEGRTSYVGVPGSEAFAIVERWLKVSRRVPRWKALRVLCSEVGRALEGLDRGDPDGLLEEAARVASSVVERLRRRIRLPAGVWSSLSEVVPDDLRGFVEGVLLSRWEPRVDLVELTRRYVAVEEPPPPEWLGYVRKALDDLPISGRFELGLDWAEGWRRLVLEALVRCGYLKDLGGGRFEWVAEEIDPDRVARVCAELSAVW